jgi:hypothetical protein
MDYNLIFFAYKIKFYIYIRWLMIFDKGKVYDR